MKKYFAILLLFSLSFELSAQTQKNDDLIISKVETLPEVKAYIKKYSNYYANHPMKGNPRPAIIIGDRPTKQLRFYWVKVGISDDYLFTTAMHFYVDPKTYVIKYYDPVLDSAFSLQTWRKKRAEVFQPLR